MNSSFSTAVNNLRFEIVKHCPEIFMFFGITGMLSAGVLAVRATPKALKLIEAEQDKRSDDQTSITALDTVKLTWRCYIPSAVAATLSTGCLIASNSVHTRRNAALATAYAFSETALKEYKEYRGKVVEAIGEEKEQAIRDVMAKEKIESNPVGVNEVIVTGKGATLCYETTSARYFRSDIDKIKKAENELNRRLLNEIWVSLNDFYDELGLPTTSLGDKLGWDIDHGFIDMGFSSQLNEDDVPCLVIEHRVPPQYDKRYIFN